MTIAPEGRTYMKKKWVLDPDIVSGKKPRSNPAYYTGADYIIEETPFVVPNGKWVMERPLGSRWCKLVGVDHSEVEDIMLDDIHGVAYVLYISDKPFGFVTAEDLEYVPGELHALPVGNRYLHVAQKIHKGELLPGIEIPKIEIVRQAPDLSRKMHDFPRGRDQKRNHVRWARLSDVVDASGLSAEQVLLGYWPYVGGSYDQSTGRHGTLLHTVTEYASAIKSDTPNIWYLDQDQSRQVASGSLHNVWIRAGLAKTILRLRALGVQPEVPQPAAG